ncbi:hypothetical protein KAH94_03815 [bacterium]|nr:hypothetical protein [bacterium]
MVKSVRFKNIVIFSMSIFSFFGSSAFGMEEFFYLFDCCVFKAENLAVLSKKTFKQKKEDEKSIEKYLGGVRIIDLPYDCMTEVVSFLKQKEAVGLRSVNKSFAKSVDRSPTVKLKEKLWLNVKNIDCFIKSFLLSDMKNKKFKIIDIWCRPSEKLDFSQNSISKINSVSEKVSLVVDGSKKRYSNSLKSYIAFFASSVDFFLNKDKTILSSGGLDKKASLVYLQNLFIQKSSDFGKTDIKFPSGLKELWSK